MTIAYACDYVGLRVGISGRNSFKEGRIREKLNFFLKNGKTVICCYNIGGNSRKFLDLG